MIFIVKVPIFNGCITGLMTNLIKKFWTDSILHYNIIHCTAYLFTTLPIYICSVHFRFCNIDSAFKLNMYPLHNGFKYFPIEYSIFFMHLGFHNLISSGCNRIIYENIFDFTCENSWFPEFKLQEGLQPIFVLALTWKLKCTD